jgi:hypothetical protein
MLIFQFFLILPLRVLEERMERGGLMLRDQREEEGFRKQKTFNPGKTENEGIQRIPPALTGWAGLILLFDGEVGPAPRDHDEHNQTVILTSGLNLAPAFPVLVGPVAVGVCSPLQWRNRP